MPDKVTIAVDAMGGDDAPGVVLDGCAAALAADPACTSCSAAPPSVVGPFAAAHERCTAQPADEVIGMGEHPAEAVRRRRTRPSWWGAAW